jgi:hypothetical protein
MLILSTSAVQPVIKNLSNVCKNCLAMEKENKRMAAELADVRFKCFFRVLFMFLGQKSACWHINLSLRQSGVATQAAADKSSLKAQMDGFIADNSLLKTHIESLAVKVTQLKAEQAKAQELQLLHVKRHAEVDSREKSLR